MKHSVAQKIIKEALTEVEPSLRLVRFHDGRLPASPKAEVAYNVDTGPGTVCTSFWVKNGRLQQTEAWDPYPYTYWDLNNPAEVSTWAAARKSLIKTNALKKKMEQLSDDYQAKGRRK